MSDLQEVAARPKPPAPDPDEKFRHLAAEHMAEQLGMSVSLVGRCTDLAGAARGDRVGPLAAAARLMNASARVGQVLAHVALVERRHCSIVERIQPPKPAEEELNSQKRDLWLRPRNEVRQEIGAKLAKAIAADRRARLNAPGNPHEEANLTLAEEAWNEAEPGHLAMDIYCGAAESLRDDQS
jgi:hypothetical protein